MKNYNTTELSIDYAEEKLIQHRDYIAHCLRWTHALRRLKINMNVLDFGCGHGELAEVMYRNKYKGNCYLGLDIRKNVIEKNRDRYKTVPWVYFNEADLSTSEFKLPLTGVNSIEPVVKRGFDLIVSYEVIEHVGKQRGEQFLENISKLMHKDTILLLSTPCYDPEVGAAGNHTYDSGDNRGIQSQEFTYQEMFDLLKEKFIVVNRWGTFASQRDYKKFMDKYKNLEAVFSRLHEYYDSNILSCLMAPLFPEHSRNVIWECKLK